MVEDNVANAGIILTTLQLSGATTHYDRWGTHTLMRIKELGKIDLILMDLMLANGMSGYDVYDRIRADPALCHIPAVVVSASDATIEMEKARQHGFAGYISKPIHYATFAQSIARILEGEEVWADDLFS